MPPSINPPVNKVAGASINALGLILSTCPVDTEAE